MQFNRGVNDMAQSVLAVLGENRCVPLNVGGRLPVGHPSPDNKVLVQALGPEVTSELPRSRQRNAQLRAV